MEQRLYYLNDGQQQTGPFTLETIAATKPKGVTHVWFAGLENWLPVDQVPEVLDALREHAPPPPPPAIDSAATPHTAAPVQVTAQPMMPRTTPDHALADEIDRFYGASLLSFVLYSAVAIITIVAAIVLAVDNDEDEALAVGVIGGFIAFILLIVHIVCWCMLHYRIWRVAVERTGYNEYTPGQAVGFLFIPFFNIYWQFVSYGKVGELLNLAMQRSETGPGAPRVNTGTSTAYCVLSICAIVPYLGLLIALANIFVWFSMYNMHRTAATWLLRRSA